MPWFKDEVFKDSTSSETLTWLAAGLKFDVISCTAYEVNNCIFYTKSRDEKSTFQNSGVTLEAKSMQFSTSNLTSHVMSRSGYRKLEQTLMVEKEKSKQETLFENVETGVTFVRMHDIKLEGGRG